MRRWILVVSLLVLVVAIGGPTAAAVASGRPIYADCGTLDDEACSELWRPLSGNITPAWVVVKDCSEVTLGRWWPMVDPFSITFYSLCQDQA